MRASTFVPSALSSRTITAAGNDTTTWEVNIRGNPVHLVIP
jgi:hypothetical protein